MFIKHYPGGAADSLVPLLDETQAEHCKHLAGPSYEIGRREM